MVDQHEWDRSIETQKSNSRTHTNKEGPSDRRHERLLHQSKACRARSERLASERSVRVDVVVFRWVQPVEERERPALS